MPSPSSVATAISNAQARVELARLAEEQAALRRVATLVAHGAPPGSLFAVVAEQVTRVLNVAPVSIVRYEDDGSASERASFTGQGELFAVGTRWPLDGTNVVAQVLRDGPSGPHQRLLRADRRDRRDRASHRDPLDRWDSDRRSGPTVGGDGGFVDGARAAARGHRGRLARLRRSSWRRRSPTPRRARRCQRLADEQAALRRVATLVARKASQAEVFTAIAEEIGQLFGTEEIRMLRYEGDRSAVVVASSGDVTTSSRSALASRWEATMPPRASSGQGAPARIDDYGTASGPIAETRALDRHSLRRGRAHLVEGRLWGAMITGTTREEPLPPETESRLGQFTELMATAIANTESRARADRLTEEQAALRRVATLVAKESPPAEVFAKVAEELANVLGDVDCSLFRDEGDGTASAVALWGAGASAGVRVGTRLPVDGDGVIASVLREGRPCRIGDYSAATGTIAQRGRELGIRSAVGCPIVVGGRIWGAMGAGEIRGRGVPAGDRDAHRAVRRPRGHGDRQRRGARGGGAARRGAGRAAAGGDAGRARGPRRARCSTPWPRRWSALLDADAVDAEPLRARRPRSRWSLTAGWTRRERAVGHAREPRGRERDGVGAAHGAAGPDGRLRAERTGAVRSSRAAHGSARRASGRRSSWRAGCGASDHGELEGRGVTAGRAPRSGWPGSPSCSTPRSPTPTAVTSSPPRGRVCSPRATRPAAAWCATCTTARSSAWCTPIVTLKLAQRALGEDDGEAASLVGEALEHAEQGNAELRELAHGILPAVLTHGGLRAGVEAVVARVDLPVEVDVPAERFPAEIEASAYFIVAEALTNVVKHAHADARRGRRRRWRTAMLHVEVRDDGIGGADPGRSRAGRARRPGRPRSAGGSQSRARPAAAPLVRAAHDRRSPRVRLGELAQVGQYGEHAPMLGRRRPEAELVEDAGHVLLDRRLGDDQRLGDALIRLPLGHRRRARRARGASGGPPARPPGGARACGRRPRDRERCRRRPRAPPRR